MRTKLHYLVTVLFLGLAISFIVACAQLKEYTGLDGIKHKTADGKEVGCGPIDPVTKIQECSADDGQGNVTTWTVNHNKGPDEATK